MSGIPSPDILPLTKLSSTVLGVIILYGITAYIASRVISVLEGAVRRLATRALDDER